MRKLTESDLQISVIEYLKLVKPKAFYFHVPNGGRRGKREAAEFKRMGVQPGVSDLLFLLPGGRVGAIELKLPKGRQSDAQKAFAETCDELDVKYVVAHSIEEVAQTLREWGCL